MESGAKPTIKLQFNVYILIWLDEYWKTGGDYTNCHINSCDLFVQCLVACFSIIFMFDVGR